MTTSVQFLWNTFLASPSPRERRALVLQYLALVHYVVARLGNLSQASGAALEKEDLVQFGVLGLIDAIDRFSPAVGVKFETFAIPRVRGAILDEVRSLDWAPRSVRTNARRVEAAAAQLTQKMGREAADHEIAGKLAITVPELRRILSDAGAATPSARPGPAGQGEEPPAPEEVAEEGPDPLERLAARETRSRLAAALRALPERSRKVVALYYYEGMKFGEIARVLKVSESRVSQIHAEVLQEMRSHMAGLT